MSVGDAMEELRRCSGTQFDPDVVERFIEVVRQSEAGELIEEHA
jgi:HD-GYP domain-containing protein (c-di-GMP phosphodiesterase class II)